MRYIALLALAGIATTTHAMLPNPTDATNSTNTAPVVANTQTQVSPVVNAFIVKSVGGAESLIPVSVGTPVQSGDILEYQGLFTNNGERVRKMDVTLTIADGLELVGGVTPKHAQASHDGSRFVRMPIRAKIDGEVKDLPLAHYKALRWTIEDVGLGGTAVVKYRALVK